LIAAIGAVPSTCRTSRECARNLRCVHRQCVNSTCPTVTVLGTWDGDLGTHFVFSAEEFSNMVGYEEWDGQEYVIVQSGSNSWEGVVSVSKGGKSSSFTISGDESAAGELKVSDTISLKSCINPDKHPCKDVTFGNCDRYHFLGPITLSKKSQKTVQLCNADCYVTDNCTNYRYNNQTNECTLMSKDYRGGMCEINAGPRDKKVIDCIGQYEGLNNEVCDFHMEEDCEYNGELLMRYLDGEITSADTCQENCRSDSDCKYWIYNNSEISCILKRDGKKTCTVLGGPKQPSYDQCQN